MKNTKLSVPLSKRSIRKLEAEGFDPISELVNTYNEVNEEITLLKAMRSGEIMVLNPVTGKPRSYHADTHLNLLDKKINIADKLLRYQYSRVPENTDDKNATSPQLTINLTAKGEKYQLNAMQEEVESVDDMYGFKTYD